MKRGLTNPELTFANYRCVCYTLKLLKLVSIRNAQKLGPPSYFVKMKTRKWKQKEYAYFQQRPLLILFALVLSLLITNTWRKLSLPQHQGKFDPRPSRVIYLNKSFRNLTNGTDGLERTVISISAAFNSFLFVFVQLQKQQSQSTVYSADLYPATL